MGQVLILGGGGIDTSGVTAGAGDVLYPKVFVDRNGNEVTGAIISQSEQTINVDASDRTSTIPTGKYLSGDQTLRAVTYNLPANKVLSSASLKVGDSVDDDRIIAFRGSIESKVAATYNTSDSDQIISPGQYLSGDQTIRGVTTDGLTDANIKYNVTVHVGDAGSASRVASITGTFTGDGTVTEASQVRKGYVCYSKGTKYTGTHNPTSTLTW